MLKTCTRPVRASWMLTFEGRTRARAGRGTPGKPVWRCRETPLSWTCSSAKQQPSTCPHTFPGLCSASEDVEGQCGCVTRGDDTGALPPRELLCPSVLRPGPTAPEKWLLGDFLLLHFFMAEHVTWQSHLLFRNVDVWVLCSWGLELGKNVGSQACP